MSSKMNNLPPHHHYQRQDYEAQGFSHHADQHHPGQHPNQPQLNQCGPPQKWHSYKVLVDPLIHRGAPKLVRYDGAIVPGDPHHIPPNPSDPRSKLPNALWKRLEAMELPVPKFKVDDNYVGDPPKTEVTFENLNDNVDSQFLHSMVVKFGIYEELCIHFHPITRKHLGLARVVFEEVKSAKECVRQLHGKSVMGKVINAYIDPRGASCHKMYMELTEEPVIKLEPPPPLPPPPVTVVPEVPPPPVISLRTMSLDDSPQEELNVDPRLAAPSSHWERERTVPEPPERDSRRRDSSSGRRSDYNSSRDRAAERWSGSRERHRERLRERDRGHERDSSSSERHAASATRSQYDPMKMLLQSKFDPSYAHPDYWQQAAQQYAMSQGIPPPIQPAVELSESPNDKKVEDTTDRKKNNVDYQVDLDTRLKMLMKDKTGAMPAFLLQELNSNSDNSDKETEKRSKKLSEKDDPDAPLSRPPSPFLSADHYYANLRNRAKKSRASKNARLTSRNSDRMSLSSLSSGDHPNESHQQPPQPPVPPPPLPPPNPYFGFYAQPPPPGHPPPQGFPGTSEWNGMYPPPHMQYAGFGQPPGFPGFMQQAQPYPAWSGEWSSQEDPYSGYYSKQKNDKNSYRPIISETVRCFVEELKRALIKDVQKKMCETYAFIIFEEWWQSQEKKYKERQARLGGNLSSISVPMVGVHPSANKENTSTNVSESSISMKQFPRIPKAEDLSSLFDKQRENMEANRSLIGASFGAGGSLGFGFRGTIPKLPSFKRKVYPSAVTSNRDRTSTSRRSDGFSSDDSKNSSKNRKTISERRREHEQRREERMEKDKQNKNSENKNKDKDRHNKDVQVEDNKKDTKSKSDIKEESRSKIIEKDFASSEPPSRKVSSQSSLDELSEASHKKSRDKTKRLKKKKKSSTEDEPTATSGDESSTSKRSISSKSSISAAASSDTDESSKVASKTKTKSPRKSSVASSSKSGSGSEASASEASASEASSKSSSDSNFEEELEEEPSSTTSLEEEEVKKKKKSLPARRQSVTVSKIDDIPNGEIRDLDRFESNIEEPIVSEIMEPQPTSTTTFVSDRNDSPAYMIDHCYAKPIGDKQPHYDNEFETQFANDHGYSRPRTPAVESTPLPTGPPELPKVPIPKSEILQSVRPKQVKPVHPPKPVLPVKPAPPPKPKAQPLVAYQDRSSREEFEILYQFLTKGLDLEDIRYFKISYQMMLKREEMSKLLNYTHWVDHPVPELPPAKRRKSDNDFSRPHLTGSCRTEGYYKMDPREKRRTKYHLQRTDAFEAMTQQYRLANTEGSVTKAKGQTSQSQSREARSNQRRQLAVLGDEALNSDLLKFNQLKFRRKQLAFGKSEIHDWGLFAREDIGADEMVIEYVGHVIRPLIADVWEKQYEKQGIGSSYLFRIDQDYVVDATKRGNLARFINHSCDPNCYAKIITIDGEKKIVIYSKQPIAFGEEITYDYKFPIEDEKILCLCGAKNCRKYLN